METDEIEKLETIKRLTSSCLSTLRPVDNKNRIHSAEIKVYDYYELASVIRNLMKLCVVALDHDGAEVPVTIENRSIDVGLILGIALQLFPIDEFELLNEISILFPVDHDQMINEKTENQKENFKDTSEK
ncbi:hypothetical protein CLU83_4153 [Flavobacterium sp. 1]|uniref:hypothetical protein n=1 Tax=Flavobacterium sp. 1 TaxID=2035200 RepID=UPI000CCA8902|nr:hypothetical protein [Flavobacterium sp. 1]PJJ10697.1 hypothetical protein CLU83_4153 [Flavobacterium sp. 1]